MTDTCSETGMRQEHEIAAAADLMAPRIHAPVLVLRVYIDEHATQTRF
jgi:hypothetical protein